MSSDDHALAVDDGNHSKSFNNSNKYYDLQIVLTQEEFNVLGNLLTHSLTYSLTHSLTHSLTYSFSVPQKADEIRVERLPQPVQ